MKRRWLILVLLLAAGGWLLPRLLLSHDLERLGGDAFAQALERLLERSRELARRAQEFEPQRALDALPDHPWNGFVYRFDERLAEARVSPAADDASPAQGRPAGSPLPRLTFDGDDSLRVSDPSGEARLEGGRLLTTADPRRPLELPLDSLDPRRVGAIRLEISAERGTSARLSWFDANEKLGELTLALRTDGELHSYTIDAVGLLRDSLSYHADGSHHPLERLTLSLSEVPGDPVALGHLEFLTRRAAYGHAPAGRTHVELGSELRAGLHVSAPRELAYRVQVPADAPRRLTFRCGVGALPSENGEGEVHFLLRRGGPEPQVLARRSMSTADRWAELEAPVDVPPDGQLELTLVTESDAPRVALWSNPRLVAERRQRRHIVMVLEDTLRADHLSAYGYGRDTSPFKRAFFARGAVFEQAFSQATKTRPSCPSLMSSLPPSATGVWDFGDVLDEGFVTLAEVLRSQGFRTAAFVQNPNGGPAAGLHQGFSVVFDKDASGMRTEELLDADLDDWIAANERENLFVYLHLVDPHGPYDPTPPSDRWYHEGGGSSGEAIDRAYLDAPWVEPPTLEGRRRLYDGEIESNDRALGAFVERLEVAGLARDTLFIFLSDHGEYLGEHGLWEHHPPGHREVLHVPLALVGPDLPAGVRVTENVQLMDVMPTLLDWSRIESEGLLLQGDSLLPLIHGQAERSLIERVVLSEEVVQRTHKRDHRPGASLFFGPWQLLRSPALPPPPFPTPTRLRVVDRRDPRAAASPWNRFAFDWLLQAQVDDALEELARNHALVWRALRSAGPAGAKGTWLEPEDLERLRELGYL